MLHLRTQQPIGPWWYVLSPMYENQNEDHVSPDKNSWKRSYVYSFVQTSSESERVQKACRQYWQHSLVCSQWHIEKKEACYKLASNRKILCDAHLEASMRNCATQLTMGSDANTASWDAIMKLHPGFRCESLQSYQALETFYSGDLRLGNCAGSCARAVFQGSITWLLMTECYFLKASRRKPI